MIDKDVADDTVYRVVLNHEEQYSIWPAGKENPLGWSDAGKAGTKAECLTYIEEVWTDMRPLSLRLEMEKLAKDKGAYETALTEPHPADPHDDLVMYLSQGDHPVEPTAKSVEQFLERIESGYVNMKFTDTRGGTVLGIKLDPAASKIAGDKSGLQQNKAHIVGELTLNYQQVRLIADVELDTLKGLGHLEIPKPRLDLSPTLTPIPVPTP